MQAELIKIVFYHCRLSRHWVNYVKYLHSQLLIVIKT